MTKFEQWVDARWPGGINSIVSNKAGARPHEMKDCPEPWRTLFIVTAGLAGETGEVVEHIKKLVRDGKLDRDALRKELGDQHHYAVKLWHMFGFTQEEIENANVEKLEERDAIKRAKANGRALNSRQPAVTDGCPCFELDHCPPAAVEGCPTE